VNVTTLPTSELALPAVPAATKYQTPPLIDATVGVDSVPVT
jgi:hypothetical protein